jgi:predicted MFS family arabinose efflux permease
LDSAHSRLKVILAGLCALVLSVGLARFAYTPMLPIMQNQAGLTAVAGGWLATCNYAGYLCGVILTASISSPRIKFLLYRAGLLLALISTLSMGFTHSTLVWGVLRFFSGLSSVAGLLLASGLVLNWMLCQGHRPELGLHFTGMGIGIVFSGVAVQWMSSGLDWTQDWIVLGISGAGFFLVAWCWMPAPGGTEHPSTGASSKMPAKAWLSLLGLSYFCAGFGYVVSATFVVDIVNRITPLQEKGNLVWILVGLAAIPASFIWDRVSRSRGAIEALIIAYLLQAVSILLLVLSSSVVCIMVSAILFGWTFIGIVSLTLVVIGLHYPENPSKAMARLSLSYGAAQVLGPVMTGYLTGHYGSYTIALMFVAAIMLLGVVFLIRLAHTPVYPPDNDLRAISRA